MTILFIGIIFSNTSNVKGWSHHQYLFLTGTHMILTSLFETFFFGNCWRVSEMVRNGDLDFVLLRPANAQFLVSFERLDLSSLTNVFVGAGVCIYALKQGDISVTSAQVFLYITLLFSGLVTLYSLVMMFATTSVWFVRQTSLNSLWFYAVSLARYPADIYKPFLGGALWFVLVFIFPVLLVANLPASTMVKVLQVKMILYAVGLSAVLLLISHYIFQKSLYWYRSASS